MDKINTRLLIRLTIQSLELITIHSIERIIKNYVSGLNTKDETISLFNQEITELSYNISQIDK